MSRTAMTNRSWRRGMLGIVVGFALAFGLAYALLEILAGRAMRGRP